MLKDNIPFCWNLIRALYFLYADETSYGIVKAAKLTKDGAESNQGLE